MDFTGLNRFHAYKLDRPLTEEERKGQLNPKKPVSDDPLDWLSVIKINSTYLELVDRWYAGKGFATWMGGMFAVPFTLGLFYIIYSSIKQASPVMWMLDLLFSLAVMFFAWVGIWIMRHEVFRQTHYPIRLNRKTRQVYAYRPDGTILRADWDKLFICAITTGSSEMTRIEDIRAHVLAEDGETVKDTFTLGYPYLGNRKGLLQLWEYIRRYMEEPDGVERNYKQTEICMPLDGRREGLVFGLVRAFAPMAKWPLMQLLVSPLWTLTTLGRWFAMYTCKVPRWPEEVEAACQVGPDDPYQKDWRDNGKYDFWELGWPLVCFAVGLTVLGIGAVWLVRAWFS
ncbi:hypothetical protein HOP51_16830 [Halomonas sp. MCCC 1A11036]|uniref:DUF6708 domain-containing protein n=1 Tax=Billgrantia zhangzhouensis TaxID=2733481 RepID=A0ABS9AJ55_9GAMM|nr:DUF6708 domain-containing protein [Halomonas zhangzhouensis]MCE8021764.1 hypothetical protein [Halomonas zhangzhouensis]